LASFSKKHPKIWWGVVVALATAIVIAEPLAVWFDSPWLSLTPLSEAFTVPVSTTFVGGINGVTNITQTTYFPSNGTSKMTTFSQYENLGYGKIILEARGALSVDNVVTESIEWLFPTSVIDKFEKNTSVVFHTYFSYNDPPPTDQFGVPEVGNITLHSGRQLVLENGTVWGQEWDGSCVVTFTEAGGLPSTLIATNVETKLPPSGNFSLITVNGVLPSVIEIETADGTSTVRNDDIVTSLTFAILLFMWVDLGSYDGEDKCKYHEPEKETQQPSAKPNRQRFR
jgi:hypothetical protein